MSTKKKAKRRSKEFYSVKKPLKKKKSEKKLQGCFKNIVYNIGIMIAISAIVIPIAVISTIPQYKYLFNFIKDTAFMIFFTWLGIYIIYGYYKNKPAVLFVGILCIIISISFSLDLIPLALDLPQYIKDKPIVIQGDKLYSHKGRLRNRSLSYKHTFIIVKKDNGEEIKLYGDYHHLENNKKYKVQYYTHSKLIKDIVVVNE